MCAHREQGFQEQHEASSSRPFEASTRSVQLHVPPSFTQHAHQGHRSWDGDEEPPFMDGRHAPGHLPSHAPSFAERPSETPPWSAGLSSQSQQAPEKNQSFTQSAPQRPQQNRQQFDNEIWPKVCVSGACLRNVSSVVVISLGMLTLRCRAFCLNGHANLSGCVLVMSALLACFELC